MNRNLSALLTVFAFILSIETSSAGIFNRRNPTQPSRTDFIAGIDARVHQEEGRRLTIERYNRLMARLSVFALYCYKINNRPLNEQFSKFRLSAPHLEKEAVRIFGSLPASYNRFEKARGEESVRIVATNNVPQTCVDGQATFDRYVKMSARDFDNLLSSSPHGRL